MKKVYIIVLFIIQFILINSCVESDSKEIEAERIEIEVKLKTEIDKALISFQKDSIYPIIDFAKLTNFKWDTIYIYERYRGPDQLINRCKWSIIKQSGLHTSDDNFIKCFFIRNDTVIQFISIETSLVNTFIFEIDFDTLNLDNSRDINYFSYEKAKFEVLPKFHENNLTTTPYNFILRDLNLGCSRKFVDDVPECNFFKKL